MAKYTGTIIKGSPGNMTVRLPFTATSVDFFVRHKTGAVDDKGFLAIGHVSASGSQWAESTDFINPAAPITQSDNTKCIIHYEMINQVKTAVIIASFVSWGTNRMTLNFFAASAAYPIYMRLSDEEN